MTIRFDGRVAIVTGAGNGLGRTHALGLAGRGAKVVVNDFGGARDGTGGSLTPAEAVVAEIRQAGGIAMADGADVSNFEQVQAMVDRATKEWGKIDLLCANAGILRDKSFAKMETADFARVLDVHLVGTFNCCKAVWHGMRERNFGRIVVTTSSSGLFGNFGQANYGAAKAGIVGLMNVLAEEGRKNDIRVNTISPTAATRMTEELLPPQALALMRPESITPAVLYLLSDDAPTRTIMGAGAGSLRSSRSWKARGSTCRTANGHPRRLRLISARSVTCRRPGRWKTRSSRPRNMSPKPRRGRA
jgi:NAD(P)-dependent dehydrogenase (short-subunit alcohol dehydrogenase family)